MTGHSIRIELNNEQEKFLKWLAKRDGVSCQEELQMLFYTELREMREYCAEEYEGEIK